MKAPGRESTEKVLRNLEEMHQKLKMIENSWMQRRARLRSKVEDLKQSLRLIAAMKSRQVSSSSFGRRHAGVIFGLGVCSPVSIWV